MINTVDTPNLTYKLIILEIIPELPRINDTDMIQDETGDKKS